MRIPLVDFDLCAAWRYYELQNLRPNTLLHLTLTQTTTGDADLYLQVSVQTAPLSNRTTRLLHTRPEEGQL